MQRVIGPIRAMPGRLFPGLDEWLWNRQRDRWCRAQGQSTEYLAALRKERVDPSHLPVRVVVVPMDGPDVPTWQAAGGNHFYEIWQSARELFGPENVELFSVSSHESPREWHGRLIDFLQDVGATHLVFQVEHDPNQPEAYTWDLFLASVTPRWNGVLLGVIYDSAFEWITIAARRLARLNDHFVLVDICQPMDVTRDFVESRTNQPTYLHYMAGLYRSRMTINLSASSSGNGQQLKTRVLEACLVGTVVLTDDSDRTERFWKADRDFIHFDSIDVLAASVVDLERNPERREDIARHARARARELNVMGFWGGIDQGLKARSLQPLITSTG